MGKLLRIHWTSQLNCQCRYGKCSNGEIIAQNAFTSTGGDLIEKKSARLVENIVDDIELG